MKIQIPLKTLIVAALKGGAGALTKESQEETRKKIRPTDACLKISVLKDCINFESSSPKISVHHSIPRDENIIADEEGSFCIDANEYLKMLNTIGGDCNVQLSHKETGSQTKDSLAGFVEPSGKLTTVIVSKGIKKRKGFNDTYPVEEFVQVNYDYDNALFSIKAKYLKKAINNVAMATDPTDLSGLLCKIALFITKEEIFFAGTNGQRCAMFKVDDVKIKSPKQKILIDAEALKLMCDDFEDDCEVDVFCCKDKEHIVLTSGKTIVKLCMASEKEKEGFPNVGGLFKIQLVTNVIADKSDLSSAIEFLSQYNSEKLIFNAKTKEANLIGIYAAGRGDNPENALVECEKIENPPANPIAMSIPYIKDYIKKISGDKVKFLFSEDEKKIKLESLKDPNFIYLMQCMTVN